ncbi:DUF6177 family protein [Streptomyces sp. TRM 70351]|uniref:DUF6177 family protein n=1 Tax=Streptomyces sp. TRM 70351 TaxID=3116552 RepID=UPI002E7ADC3D|nr:DUF6177 family protein [Streptomyces sp. TRM 70351]MEE1930947.1 DUF6177 family protein [Streptomyces sp. TRM 70351]
MTKDVIALTTRMPDVWSLTAGLMSGGPRTRLATAGEGAVVQLCDAGGRPLVSVEAPLLVRVPGEVHRLLGLRADGPVWWTEVRAATAARGGEELAGTVATRLVTRLGGTVWPPQARAGDGGSAPVREVATAAAPAAAQPAVDVLTEQAAVVIQDRPAVALTSWLADALRAAAGSGRALQIVTPRTARLTPPTRAVLSGLPNRWVVRDGDGGYFDGLSGAVLHWRDGAFTATGGRAPGYVPARPPAGRQLAVSWRTRRPAADDLLLGGALEEVWHRLTGAPPAGWGTAEPAGLPWSRQELTAYVRERSPEPTWLVVVGTPAHPAVATLRVSRTTGGVEEDVTLTAGFPGGRGLPLDALPEAAGELVAGHGLVSLLAQRRAARADLAVPAALEGPPEPVAFALGSAEVRGAGPAAARRPPLPHAPVRLGPAGDAGFYYPLGDTGWAGLERLTAHLRGAEAAGSAPPRREAPAPPRRGRA